MAKAVKIQKSEPGKVKKSKPKKVGRPKRMGRPPKQTGRMKQQVEETLLQLLDEKGCAQDVTLDMIYQRGKFSKSIAKRTCRRILNGIAEWMPLKECIELSDEEKAARVTWCEKEIKRSYTKSGKKLTWLDEHTVKKMCSIRTKDQAAKMGRTGAYVLKGHDRESKKYWTKPKRTMAFNYGGDPNFMKGLGGGGRNSHLDDAIQNHTYSKMHPISDWISDCIEYHIGSISDWISDWISTHGAHFQF